MATTPEGKVKKEVDKLIKAFGAWSSAPTTGGYGKSGGFDRSIQLNFVPIGVEVKRDADHMPTRLQTENAILFHKQGGASLCIHIDNLHILEKYMKFVLIHGARTTRYFVWPQKAIDDYNNAKEEK